MFSEIWNIASRFFYQLVTLTCMSMFPCRWKRRFPLLILSILLSGILSIVTSAGADALLHSAGIPTSYLLHQMIILFYLMVFVCLLYRGNFYSMLLTVLLAMSVAAQAGFIIGGLMERFFAPTYTPFQRFLRDLLGYGTFALYYTTLRKSLNFTTFYLTRRDHLVLIAVALIHYLATCYSVRLLTLANASSLLYYTVSLFFTCTITFLIFRYTKDHQKTLEQQMLIQDLRLSEHTLAQMQETAAQMREWKHELSNQLVYVQQLVREQRYDLLENYAAQLQHWDVALPNTVLTDNGVVNSILNQKIAYAHSLGIETQVRVVLPAALPVDDLTLCSLLGNLLNNAIEACDGQEAPFLHIDIHPAKQYLAIRIDNSVTRDIIKENPHLHSTKEDAEQHGIGIRVIRRIVEQQNGMLHYEMVGSNCFRMQVLLQM